MERSSEANRHQYHRHQKSDSSQIPPWERTSSAKVPYVDASAEPLSHAERQALRELWAANDYQSAVDSRRQGGKRPSNPDDPLALAATRQSIDTRHASALQSLPLRSRNTSLSASHESTRAQSAGPPVPNTTPPLSASSGSSFASQEQRRLQALPGTMSTGTSCHKYDQDPPRCTPDGLDIQAKDSDLHDGGKGRRMKSALKGFFKKRIVDDQEVEKIGNRHWADDSD